MTTSNSCPSLWNKSPTFFLELELEVDLEACVDFLVAHGMHLKSDKAMYLMAEESVVEKTLHLCGVKVKGELGSLIAGS